MRRPIALLAALFAVSLPGAGASATSGPVAGPAGIGYVVVKDNLGAPAAFTFPPATDPGAPWADRIFFGELSPQGPEPEDDGRIYYYDPSTRAVVLYYRFYRLVGGAEKGLLGLAFHPRYPEEPFLYVYATRLIDGVARNQILRIRQGNDGKGAAHKVIFTSDVPAGHLHNGGRILFGPKEKLFVVIGDALDDDNPQDLTVDAGKILRMNPNGSVPLDNPIPGSLVYAYGIRNSFGFTFDFNTRQMWESENGPDCNDEMNFVEAGKNYGWGDNGECDDPNTPAPQNTNQDGPDPQMPERYFTPTVAPTGTVFCNRCGLPSSHGKLFWAEFNTGRIKRAKLTADRQGIDTLSTVLETGLLLLSMERQPLTGEIYFSDFEKIYKLVETT